MTAPPEIAHRILPRLQKLSEPFGRKIVGVVRPAARVSSSPH
jgi:hypothetical protein